MSDAEPNDAPRPAVGAPVVILAGVCAALHVGKLPPAIAALQAALGMTLVEAGFLLSLVQAAGMGFGVVLGAWADGLGLRRSMLAGLLLLALASMLGAAANGVAMLLALRALEGLGFLLVALPAPALIRRLVPPLALPGMLGVWGTYMPLGAALGLLAGPAVLAAFGWRAWWFGLGLVSTAMALALWRFVPPPPASVRATVSVGGWGARLARTLRSGGPWWIALAFAVYSSQWLAVIGFLPTIYAAAGLAGTTTGVLTALAAAVNILGNLAGGRLQQRGVAPVRLLAIGYTTMALATLAAFAGTDGGGLPAAARYLAVLLFSGVGGMIPATLFALAMRLAPGEDTVSTTVGWMQQCSAFGQFAGPPLVALLASRAGGWHWTWVATGGASLLGLLLTRRIAAALRRRGA